MRVYSPYGAIRVTACDCVGWVGCARSGCWFWSCVLSRCQCCDICVRWISKSAHRSCVSHSTMCTFSKAPHPFCDHFTAEIKCCNCHTYWLQTQRAANIMWCVSWWNLEFWTENLVISEEASLLIFFHQRITYQFDVWYSIWVLCVRDLPGSDAVISRNLWNLLTFKVWSPW